MINSLQVASDGYLRSPTESRVTLLIAVNGYLQVTAQILTYPLNVLFGTGEMDVFIDGGGNDVIFGTGEMDVLIRG